MPDLLTATVGSTGRDYATPALAYADVGVGIGTSTDLVTNDEEIIFSVYADSDFTGRTTFNRGLTTDATRRVKFVAAAGNRTNGDIDTGAHVGPPTGSGHLNTISDDYLWFEGLEFQLPDTAAISDECFRLNAGVVGLRLDSCLLVGANGGQQDGVYSGHNDVGGATLADRITLINCVGRRLQRVLAHAQMFSASPGASPEQYWLLVSCTVYDNVQNGFFGYAVVAADSFVDAILINNIVISSAGFFSVTSGSHNDSRTNFSGGGNISESGHEMRGTEAAAHPLVWTDDTDPDTNIGAGDYGILADISTSGGLYTVANLRPVEATGSSTNDLLDAGIGPSDGTWGSYIPTTDIEGNARSGANATPGAYELSSGTTLNRAFVEAVGLTMTEARSAATDRALAEALAFAIAEARSAATDRALAEALAFAIAEARAVAGARAINETLPIAMTEARTVAGARAINETLPIAMTEARSAVLSRALSEGLGLVDSLARTIDGLSTVNRAFTESMSVAMAEARAVSAVAALEESLGLTSSNTRFASATAAFAESLPFGDTLQAAVSLDRQLAESLTVADAAALGAVASRVYSEAFALGDSLEREGVLARAVSESMSLLDSLARAIVDGTQINRAFSETIGLTASHARSAQTARAFAETLTLAFILQALAEYAAQLGFRLAVSYLLDFRVSAQYTLDFRVNVS